LQLLPVDLLPFYIPHCCWFSIVPTLMASGAAYCHYRHHQWFIVNKKIIAVSHMAVTASSLLVAVTAFVTTLRLLSPLVAVFFVTTS